MKQIKRIVISLLLGISIILMPLSNIYAAEEDISTKLKNFVESCYEDGYMNSTLRVTQITNTKYKINFFYKENIEGMDLGFYVFPSVCETLKNIDIDYDTYAKGNYAYVISEFYTNNLHYDLQRLSVLPFITVNAYINEDTKENVIKGNFDTSFYREEREENELINDIFSTNYFSFEYLPIDTKNFNSNAPMISNDDYFVWFSSGEYNYEIDGISVPVNDALLIVAKIVIIVICFVVLFLLIFIIIKLIKKKKNDKNDNNESLYDIYDEY